MKHIPYIHSIHNTHAHKLEQIPEIDEVRLVTPAPDVNASLVQDW